MTGTIILFQNGIAGGSIAKVETATNKDCKPGFTRNTIRLQGIASNVTNGRYIIDQNRCRLGRNLGSRGGLGDCRLRAVRNLGDTLDQHLIDPCKGINGFDLDIAINGCGDGCGHHGGVPGFVRNKFNRCSTRHARCTQLGKGRIGHVEDVRCVTVGEHDPAATNVER